MVEELQLNSVVIDCYHCGNRTPHDLMLDHTAKHVYGDYETEQAGLHYFDIPFTYLVYSCTTCQGISLFGGFIHEYADPDDSEPPYFPRLFPRGPSALIQNHLFDYANPIPPFVYRSYEQGSKIRHRNPSAFCGQIGVALEHLCADKGITSGPLHARLRKLAEQGIIPDPLGKITALLRKVRNQSVHASADEGISPWDAELIDRLFMLVLEYVYIVPFLFNKLEKRLDKNDQEQ